MGFLKKFQDAKKEVTAEALKAEELQILPVEHKSKVQLLQEENIWKISRRAFRARCKNPGDILCTVKKCL